jgi:thiosulfate reductase cytochrome b subunit
MSKYQKVYMFKAYTRFWHWCQAFLIIFMAFTGFEIHGTYHVFGFERVVELHTMAAWALIYLWLFSIFWHLTTGEWKQYVPTMEKVVAMARYYSIGIFNGDPHPFRPTPLNKLNPLQKLSYLAFKVVLAPLIWITGLLYMFYNDWAAWGLDGYGLTLGLVAMTHILIAYCLLTFLCAHLALITTGHTVFSHLKAMITGWDEVEHDENEAEEAGS